MQMYKKAIITFALATKLLTLFIEENYKKHKIPCKKSSLKIIFVNNQQPPHHSPPITSLEPPVTPTITHTNNPLSSTRISF